MVRFLSKDRESPIRGASTKPHPAPFPVELASRLVRMFSFWGDTVLDPFCGTGTTMVAAMKHHRNSIGIEIDREYCRMAAQRLRQEQGDFFHRADLKFQKQIHTPSQGPVVREERAEYRTRRKTKTAQAVSS